MQNEILERFNEEARTGARDNSVIYFRGSPRFLGRWQLGSPVGEWGMSDVPAVPDIRQAKTEQEKLDNKTANVLLARKPRLLWDSLQEVRGKIAEFARRETQLQKAGYSGQALQSELWRQAGRDAAATMREAAGRASDTVEEVQRYRAKLSTTHFEPEEDSAARAAFDLAIAQRFAAADAGTRAQMRLAGDPRTLAALQRVPRAISGITDAELDESRAHYLKMYYPSSAATFEALTDYAAAPVRVAIGAGLRMLQEGTARGIDDLVSGWGPAGRWAAEGINANGVDA